MANGLFVPNAAGAVRTLARGLGQQRESRQAQANVERQFQFQEEQKAVENAALIKERERKQLLNELARGEKRTSDHKFAERFPDAFDKQITRNNAITDELYPGSPNLSGAKIRANLPTWQKDIALEQSYIKEFGEGSPEHVAILNDIIPNYIDRPIEQKILGGKIGDIAAEELAEKKLTTAKELETFKTDEEIRQERERVETLAGIKEEATTAEQERLVKLLDEAGLDAETKSKIMIAAQAGIGAPAEAALFPKTKEDVRFMPTFNEFGEKTGAVPVKTFTDPKTGKFVFQQAEKFVPEQAVAGVQEPGAPAIQAPEVVAPKPEPEVQNLLKQHREEQTKKTGAPTRLVKTVEKKETKLSELKHVKGAPTLGEYLEFIANNPVNVDAQGNIIITESLLIDDYAQILRTQETKNAAKSKQKALK